MSISVPSRFACLRLEDDDSKSSLVAREKQSQDKTKMKTSAKPTKQRTVSSNSTKRGKATAKKEVAQWMEWQKKDRELVDDHYEEDLKSAIFQSQLEVERLRQVGAATADIASSTGKKKKSKTISLDEFLQEEAHATTTKSPEDKPRKEGDFFATMHTSTQQAIIKERVERKRRERTQNIDEVVSLAQCQEKLEKEREKNRKLTEELLKAKAETSSVKERNQLLCNMLGQGEMKDKADVLLELEKLNSVKEELTEEVARLHKLLEQERSNKTKQAKKLI